MPASSSYLNSIRHTNSYTMPVLSPRHSSSSTLTGSYRSTFSSSTIDRPYYGSTSSYTTPRITNSYSERYSTRSYDDKKLYTRHSITEDRYETTSTSRRDSLPRGDRSSSIRESSLTRDGSVTRNSSSSTMSMLDSVADLRSKYSPANYVPAVLRKDSITRSKSINDIGKPPVIGVVDAKNGVKLKKVMIEQNGLSVSSALTTNHTNLEDDTNGNNNRTSVAEIRKKFDQQPTRSKTQPANGLFLIGTPLVPPSATTKTYIKNKLDTELITNHVPAPPNTTTTTTTDKQKLDDTQNGTTKYFNRPAKIFKITDLPQPTAVLDETKSTDSSSSELSSSNIEDSTQSETTSTTTNNPDMDTSETKFNHTTNYASYIPIKDFNADDNKSDEDCVDIENNSSAFACQQNRLNNDITTSPRLNRAAISQNSQSPASTSSGSNNIATSQQSRGSPTLDRENYRNHTRDDAHTIRSQGLNGLKNIGNTCFMNSVIQCLSNTRYLMEYVKGDAYIADINTSISSMKGALIKAFSQVLQELWSSDSSDRVVNTAALKNQIQRFAPRFIGYAQQDAQEFLRYLLEGLHEDVNRVTAKPAPILTEIDEKLSDSQKAAESWQRYLRMDNSRVVDIFVGQLKSTLRCTHCGHCSVTFDPFWDLSLPIPQRQGQLRLSQCLEHFTREETLDGDEKPTCSKCKERRKCTKSFSIQKFPKILVIHLKRFSPTERFRGKLSIIIDFPFQDLDLNSFAANKGQTDCLYNLYAISNHSGTTYSGHYTAYCKHPYSGQWHEYNDSRVSTISSKNVVSSEAYVLFYELVGQHSHL